MRVVISFLALGFGLSSCSPDNSSDNHASASSATGSSSVSGLTSSSASGPGTAVATSPFSSATQLSPTALPSTSAASATSAVHSQPSGGSGGQPPADAGGLAGAGGSGGTGGFVELDAGTTTEPAHSDAGFGTSDPDFEAGLPSTDSGGPGTSEPSFDDAGAWPELTISSDTSSIEFTPALYAARYLYPGTATVVTGGIPLLLSDDSIDLGTNAETQTLRRSVSRPDLRIIFTVTETFYRLIARRSAGIDSIEDLAGKTVGTPAQTSAAFYVYKTLSLAGLSIGTADDQVAVTSLFPGPGMVSALAGQNPSVEAIAAWEPYPQLALDELGGVEGDAIVFQDRDVYREIVNLHSTEAKLADPITRRGIVRFVRSLIEAAAWYREHPEEAQAFVAEELNFEPDLIGRVWEDEQFAGVLADDLLDVLEEEELWLADQEQREPRTRSELAPLVDDSVVNEALQLP